MLGVCVPLQRDESSRSQPSLEGLNISAVDRSPKTGLHYPMTNLHLWTGKLVQIVKICSGFASAEHNFHCILIETNSTLYYTSSTCSNRVHYGHTGGLKVKECESTLGLRAFTLQLMLRLRGPCRHYGPGIRATTAIPAPANLRKPEEALLASIGCCCANWCKSRPILHGSLNLRPRPSQVYRVVITLGSTVSRAA